METKERSAVSDVRDEAADMTVGWKTEENIYHKDKTEAENTLKREGAVSTKNRNGYDTAAGEVRAKPLYGFFKRFFDIAISAFASIVLLIPILIIAVLIMCKDPGAPFYVHTRVGRGHKPIRVMKLRTMRKGADKLENMLTQEQLEEYRREYKIRDDPRLIGWKKPGDGDKCFGAKLRRASLDEIMQIPYNILLKGNMSFVGPRPIMEDELQENYTPEQQELLLSVKPGLTGLWQVMGRNDCTYESGERQKFELQYIREKGIWTDVKILFKTFGTILHRGGVY